MQDPLSEQDWTDLDEMLGFWDAQYPDLTRRVLGKLKSAEVRIEDLRAVLEELVDLQNGPPLPSYEERWKAVMRKAYELLGRKVDKPPGGK